jgi:hypothetical protein
MRRFFAWYYKCRRVVRDWLFFLCNTTWEVEHHGDNYVLYENGEKDFEGRLEDLPWRIRAKWLSRLAQMDDLDDQCKEMDERWRQRRSSTR